VKIYHKGKVELLYGNICDNYYTDTGCKILLGKEGDDKIQRWHLSISHPERYPTWDEIKQARNSLLSRTKDFAMIFPREGDYVNIHPNCFHLWEIVKDELEQAIDRF
jgi:hypothetical protein